MLAAASCSLSFRTRHSSSCSSPPCCCTTTSHRQPPGTTPPSTPQCTPPSRDLQTSLPPPSRTLWSCCSRRCPCCSGASESASKKREAPRTTGSKAMLRPSLSDHSLTRADSNDRPPCQTTPQPLLILLPASRPLAGGQPAPPSPLLSQPVYLDGRGELAHCGAHGPDSLPQLPLPRLSLRHLRPAPPPQRARSAPPEPSLPACLSGLLLLLCTAARHPPDPLHLSPQPVLLLLVAVCGQQQSWRGASGQHERQQVVQRGPE